MSAKKVILKFIYSGALLYTVSSAVRYVKAYNRYKNKINNIDYVDLSKRTSTFNYVVDSVNV